MLSLQQKSTQRSGSKVKVTKTPFLYLAHGSKLQTTVRFFLCLGVTHLIDKLVCMNLLGASLWRSHNFKGSSFWQSFSVVTMWSDRRKAHFLLWLSLLPWQAPAAPLWQVPPRTPGFTFCLSSNKDCWPSTCYYSLQQLSVGTLLQFSQELVSCLSSIWNLFWNSWLVFPFCGSFSRSV